MRIEELIGARRAELLGDRRPDDAQIEQAVRRGGMDGVDVLRLVVAEKDRGGQPARDDRSAEIEARLVFPVRRLVVGERVPGVQRFVLDQELGVAVKRAGAAALNDLRPASAAAAYILVVFRGEGVVVDADVLRLLLPPRDFAARLGGGRRRGVPRLLKPAPDGELTGSQKVLELREKLGAHPLDGRSQAVLVLSLGRSGGEIRQVPEELLGGFPPVLHHQHDRLSWSSVKGRFASARTRVTSCCNSASGFSPARGPPWASRGAGSSSPRTTIFNRHFTFSAMALGELYGHAPGESVTVTQLQEGRPA